jgi:hypothetical protein
MTCGRVRIAKDELVALITSKKPQNNAEHSTLVIGGQFVCCPESCQGENMRRRCPRKHPVGIATSLRKDRGSDQGVIKSHREALPGYGRH